MMQILKAIFGLLVALPEIIAFIKEIQARYDKEAKKTKIKQDMKKITEAFEARDEKMLNEIFKN